MPCNEMSCELDAAARHLQCDLFPCYSAVTAAVVAEDLAHSQVP